MALLMAMAMAVMVMVTHVKFETIAEGNEKELTCVKVLIELLIDAAEILDEDLCKIKLNFVEKEEKL